jgi:hypothetical protein
MVPGCRDAKRIDVAFVVEEHDDRPVTEPGYERVGERRRGSIQPQVLSGGGDRVQQRQSQSLERVGLVVRQHGVALRLTPLLGPGSGASR